MEAFFSEPTDRTPGILFDPSSNNFELKGTSRPEDVRLFYYPVIEWFKKFGQELSDGTTVNYNENQPLVLNVKLDYFNSSSAKFIFDIFDELNHFIKDGTPVKVYWYFDEEDEDMRDAGEEMAEMAEMTFHFIALKSR